MKRLLESLALLFIILSFLSCGGNEKDNYKTYENSEYGFTISIPQDWTYREGFAKKSNFSTGSIVVFQAPSEGKKDLFRENVHIFSEPLPDSVKNIDEYFNYSQNYLPEQLKDLEFFEHRKIEINGESSYWIIFKYSNRLQIVHSLAYIFYRDGKGLVITCTARPEDFMNFRRTFEEIATSIEFN